MKALSTSSLLAAVLAIVSTATAAPATAPPPDVDYQRDVAALLRTYCVACHAADEPESGLVLESYAGLLKGGKHGAAIVAGDSARSRLVMMLEGRAKPVMPPKDNEAPTPQEIASLKRWIDAGAKAPTGPQPDAPMLVTPHIKPTAAVRPTITAAAVSPDGKLLAIGGFAEVRLLTSDERAPVRTFSGLRGSITAVSFSADGTRLVAAGGEAGMLGEAWLWNVADGRLLKSFVGHKDSLYAAALSPDGSLLATGSYDQQIKLWDTKTGKELRTLTGHNGAIYDLAFHPNGKILASASADRTVKLWDAATGQRLDTFSQPLKDIYAVAFSPDGRFVAAGGVDNRIRVWKLSPTAKENTNPLVYTRFAHEGAVLELAFSRDGRLLASSGEDRIVKLWETAGYTEHSVLAKQPDWAAGLALTADGSRLLAGRLDGSLDVYDTKSGQPVPLPKPELTALEPRGIQRGVATRIKLSGRHLAGLTSGKLVMPGAATTPTGAQVKLLDPPAGAQAGRWAEITVPAATRRGMVTLSLSGPGGMAELPLYVDDLPQRSEQEPNDQPRSLAEQSLPAAVWGTIGQPGDRDHMRFRGKAGQTIVLELSAAGIGSSLNATLSLLDPSGEVIANNNDFDNRQDPLVAYPLPADGVYTVRVQDQLLSGSAKHFYRLSAGELPVVTGVFPLGVTVGRATPIEFAGYNLPADARSIVSPKQAGEVPVPVDGERFRSLQAFRVLATTDSELIEREPNDDPAHATRVAAPAHVSGRLWSKASAADADLFRFTAKRGQQWVIETTASRRGSPADTRIEVLDAAGKPVERIWLQAVLDSYLTFRGINSDEVLARLQSWEEMELNQFLYMQGEVGKLFLKPRGPDSGFVFYTEGGKRRCYFDTSATSHPLDEPCYIVQPQPPGAKLLATGLPVFKLNYANDDAGERRMGSDSRLMFTAPADGDYLVRVTDTRGAGGDRFGYRLSIRMPQPDFQVRLSVPRPNVAAGSAAAIVLAADRMDQFEGEIAIGLANLPAGFSVAGPIVIQAGHLDARIPLVAAREAKAPQAADWAKVKVTARAKVAGRDVVHEVNSLPAIRLMPAPQVIVHLEPAELDIAPGTTVSVKLRVERNGFKDRLMFDVFNLPHGVIVDNIGLNGILIPEGQSERQVFLSADGWVPPVDRPCFAETKNAGAAKGGNQTSPALLLHVRPAQPANRTAGK
ncbi:MAG TPA: pre-peptidase C-terminal domain-containing protein [Pirellulales bacterium]|nr:pre-peptidase C-terminal domain-containing protein [Pirellulales bacterium]